MTPDKYRKLPVVIEAMQMTDHLAVLRAAGHPEAGE